MFDTAIFDYLVKKTDQVHESFGDKTSYTASKEHIEFQKIFDDYSERCDTIAFILRWEEPRETTDGLAELAAEDMRGILNKVDCEHSAPRFDIQRHAFLVHLAPFNSRERVAGSRG